MSPVGATVIANAKTPATILTSVRLFSREYIAYSDQLRSLDLKKLKPPQAQYFLSPGVLCLPSEIFWWLELLIWLQLTITTTATATQPHV